MDFACILSSLIANSRPECVNSLVASVKNSERRITTKPTRRLQRSVDSSIAIFSNYTNWLPSDRHSRCPLLDICRLHGSKPCVHNSDDDMLPVQRSSSDEDPEEHDKAHSDTLATKNLCTISEVILRKTGLSDKKAFFSLSKIHDQSPTKVSKPREGQPVVQL